jgi:hypothetical protein
MAKQSKHPLIGLAFLFLAKEFDLVNQNLAFLPLLIASIFIYKVWRAFLEEKDKSLRLPCCASADGKCWWVICERNGTLPFDLSI